MELLRFTLPKESCPYLEDETAQFEVKLATGMSSPDYEALLQRGWRRFGNQFFRPICPGCSKCKSIRIPVATFEGSRSQRRNLPANSDLETTIVRPQMSKEHFALYDRYHSDMAVRKGWPARFANRSSYRQNFVYGAEDFGFEFQYRLHGELLGVALVDILPTCASSVYFYYDPDLRKRGLGVFSIMKQIEFCRTNGLSYLHLGFWVEESDSMRYKANFRPHEILVGRPNDWDEPGWG